MSAPLRHERPGRMTYAATLRYLYALQYRGIKVGLRNIRHLVTVAGHPERSFPAFHVAGTNGKGSTASFLASILTAAGYRTGLYTSPHLIDFVERIRIDGTPMPETLLVDYVRRLQPAIEATGATFFEATTCIAFRYFADQGVDVAVIETGLGGRLDATNVVIPAVSIITNIGLDHQEFLGTTVRQIAREKAGIIKPGAPVVTAAEGEALQVIRATGRKQRMAVLLPGEVCPLKVVGDRSGRAVVGVPRGRWRQRGVVLGLSGAHQVSNASLALSALTLAARAGVFPRVTAEAVREGLEKVTDLAGLRCRMERIRHPRADITIDVAHNPDGVKVAVGPFANRRRPYYDVVLFGAMKDKDVTGMLAVLRRVGKVVVAVRPKTTRAASVGDIVRAGRALGLAVGAGGSVGEGLRRSLLRLGGDSGRQKARILVVGSHYVAGEALHALEKSS